MTQISSFVGIVVLYKCSLEKSNTIISLNRSLAYAEKRLTLLVYDNSPNKQYSEKKFEFGNFDIIYKHDQSNPGISKAYNEGIPYAAKHHIDWLLLLDQDSQFSIDFVESILSEFKMKLKSDIVCIIPIVQSLNTNKLFSPSKLYPGGITRPLHKVKPGILEEAITGINAGTIISRQFILSIGGFINDYPLDMLDHWYFREIKRKRKKVLLVDTVVHHNLSVNSFFEDVSLNRYESILLSETKFFKGDFVGFYIYKFRLVFRIIKHSLSGKKKYVKLAMKYLIR